MSPYYTRERLDVEDMPVLRERYAEEFVGPSKSHTVETVEPSIRYAEEMAKPRESYHEELIVPRTRYAEEMVEPVPVKESYFRQVMPVHDVPTRRYAYSETHSLSDAEIHALEHEFESEIRAAHSDEEVYNAKFSRLQKDMAYFAEEAERVKEEAIREADAAHHRAASAERKAMEAERRAA